MLKHKKDIHLILEGCDHFDDVWVVLEPFKNLFLSLRMFSFVSFRQKVLIH